MKATNEMTTNGRIGTKHVMVLLSDGVPEVLGMTTAEASADAVAKATTAKSLGTVVYTIGLGANVNPTLMKQIASLPANYYFAPTGAALASIYQTIAATECRRDPATVSGTKINDVNANGTINQGEIGIEGWEITLTEVAGNGLVLRTNTGIGGDFEFSDVIPGNYLLCEVARTGWVQTAPSVAVYSGCYFLNLDPGAVLAEQNFLNTESNKPQCRDGKDNDNDGKIDFVGGDAGCNDPEDNDENQKPIISVIGTNPAIVTLGDTYSDQSATVADPEEGDITAKLVTTGTVDTSVMGNYTITYNATDSQNVSAVTKTRTVRVVVACADGRDNDSDGKIDFAGGDTGCDNPGDNDENNRPVITILGANPFNVTQDGTFTDPGATAFDPEELDVTSAIVIAGSIDTSLVGSYTLRYNVYSEDLGCDNSEDNDENEKPVITVLGDDPFVVYLGTTFVDPSATVVDPEEGDITTPNLVTTGIVDSNILGIYTVTYNAADSKGLAADTKSRTVKVVTSCSDGKDNDGDTLIDFPADLGCDSVTDDSENAKPVISLLGDVVMNLIVGTPYVEAGATVHDEEDGQISNKLVIFGTVDSHTSGAYVITYNATDSVNVAADEVSRTINVSSGQCTENCGGSTPPACSDGSDNDGDGLADFPRDPGCDSPQDNDERDTGPVITLLGANPMSIAVGTVFVDPGATAYDPQDGDITSLIVVTGSVNSSSAGAYTLTYNVSDAQGHAATPVDRTVNVISGGGGCTSNCGGTESLIITNEKLTSTGTTTVLITWNTNLPSDSRVAYGLDPVVTLGVQPLYGYDLTTATDATATTSHSVTVEGIPSSASAYFRPVSTAGTQSAVGMELTRGGVLGESTECFYLNEYMRLGANNTPSEVTKLQSFLRNFEGFTTLEVNGFFDITTDVAVRQFQDKYKTDVLIPWNLPANTGYVYYTTQKKINEIYCQREFPMNAMQITEIMAYRQLVNESRIHGDVMPVSSVNTNTETSGDVAGANSEKLDGIAEANTSGLLADVVLTETPADAPVKVNRGRIALADLLATAPRLSNELSGTDEDQDLSEEDAEFGVVAGVSTKSGLAATIESLTDRLHLSSASLILLGLLLILAVTLGIYFIKNYNRSNETQ
ncbi:MAG: Lipoprotein [Parcubacteria group bacterium GW2011_GWA2_47_7]|nr:MAG: Lipoprotein [Parcubacteria group bacterium GW2011_GWA2_47_7]